MKAMLALDSSSPPTPDQVSVVQAALAECGVETDHNAYALEFTPGLLVSADNVLNHLRRTVWVDMLVGLTSGPMFYSGTAGLVLGLAALDAPRMVIATFGVNAAMLRATTHHEYLHTLGYPHCSALWGPCIMAARLTHPDVLTVCSGCQLARLLK